MSNISHHLRVYPFCSTKAWHFSCWIQPSISLMMLWLGMLWIGLIPSRSLYTSLQRLAFQVSSVAQVMDWEMSYDASTADKATVARCSTPSMKAYSRELGVKKATRWKPGENVGGKVYRPFKERLGKELCEKIKFEPKTKPKQPKDNSNVPSKQLICTTPHKHGVLTGILCWRRRASAATARCGAPGSWHMMPGFSAPWGLVAWKGEEVERRRFCLICFFCSIFFQCFLFVSFCCYGV